MSVMKNILKSMMLIASAATAFSACNKEVDTQEPGKTGEMAHIRFYAVVNDTETRATLTTEDEKTFTANWEVDDEMAIEALSVDAEYDEVGTATWNGTFFDTNLPSNEVRGEWTYSAYYPAKENIAFGSARTQNGSLYNSLYDVMEGDVTYDNAVLGKDNADGNMVIPMTRLTSILYFHLTSSLDEALASATLTVDGGDIAADAVTINNGALEAGANGSNTITITFAEGTAPNAQDFRLWYNIIPANTTSLTLTVTTTSGKTATLTNSKGKTYVAGKLNKVVKSGLTWEEGPFFYESFDKTNGKGGNDGQWSGSIASSTLTPDNEGWIFVSDGGADKCAKFGTSSAKGSATTPALNITSDLATLTFKAGAWEGDGTTLHLSIEGEGILSVESVTLQNSAWSEYSITIAGANEDTKIQFYTSGGKSRFFLDEIKVVAGGEPFDYLSVPSEVSVAFSETSASFDIKTGSSWTISGAEDVDIDKTAGTGNATVTLTFPVNATASDITIATLTVTAGEKTATVVVKQAGDPDAIEELTIAEFLAKEVGDAYYRLTGTITNLVSDTYGNFTLVDETGSVYVYGLTKTKVSSNDRSFGSIGVTEGDVVTLEGTRAVYNDTPQVGGPAYYISHVKAPSLKVDPTSLVFNADGGSETVTATASNFTGSVTITASSNNTQFTTSVSGTAVIVTAAENTDNEEKTGTITVTATDGTTTKTAEISVNQNKPVQPAQDGDILWQEDFTGYGTTMPATATGSHVYESGTVSYTLTNGSSDTKLYDAVLAGGITPELLVGKSNGAFKISGIPTGNATTMTLTYKANYDYCVISASNGITLRNDVTFEDNLKTVYLIVPSGVTSFDLEFKNTNSSNCRVDNFMLKAGAPKAKASQTITFGDNKSVEWVIGTDCTLNIAKQGLTVTGAQTTVTYSSSNTEVATVDNDGMVTPLKAGLVTITANAAETEEYKAATDSYMLTITDPNTGVQTVTDILNLAFTGVTGTSYVEFSGKAGTSGAVYAGQCAGGNASIQLRSKNNNSGVITTTSGGKVKKIIVTWNTNTTSGRTLNIYGKNSAYSTASDLYDPSKQGTLLGTIVYGTSTELTISDEYDYIGFRSASDAMYLDKVEIVWEQ